MTAFALRPTCFQQTSTENGGKMKVHPFLGDMAFLVDQLDSRTPQLTC